MDETHIAPRTLLLFLAFLIYVVVAGTFMCGLWYGHLSMRDVLSSGLQTAATLEDKYVVEDERGNRRFWFSYRFTTLAGDTYVSSIEVPQVLYHQHAVESSLPMRYHVHNPRYNSLDVLQDGVRSDVWQIVRLSSLVIFITVGFIYLVVRDLPPRWWLAPRR